MIALWLANRTLSLDENAPDPALPPEEALVRVRLAGICSTDLELVRGYYPFEGILGHEFVGVVEQAPVRPDMVGQRVVGEINAVCGGCVACLAGRRSHCGRRTVLGIASRDGALATYLTLPVENLHVVPDKLSDEAAVFTEPLAAALEIQQQVPIRPGDRVLVIGAGRLGQLVAQTLQLTGCALSAVARYPDQGDLLAARRIDVVAEGEVPDGSVDLVVEATGSPGGFVAARRAVRPGGVIVLKSTYAGSMEVDFSALVVDEIQLVGSRCGPFEPALRLLESGRVDPTPLIQARYPLRDGLRAFEQAGERGALKVLLEPGSP